MRVLITVAPAVAKVASLDAESAHLAGALTDSSADTSTMRASSSRTASRPAPAAAHC
jgi:hypothetical protein